MFTADVRDDKGWSQLNRALVHVYDDEDCVYVSLFLINKGCGGDTEKTSLLCAASCLGMLDVVQELVEQHKVDPSKCVLMITLPLQYSMQTVGTMYRRLLSNRPYQITAHPLFWPKNLAEGSLQPPSLVESNTTGQRSTRCKDCRVSKKSVHAIEHTKNVCYS